MCDISPALSNLLSGLVGSVIGAGATVWATSRALSASAEQLDKQREQTSRLEYKQRLEALSAEVAFNISLEMLSGNKKIIVFVHNAWDNFMAHAHQLPTAIVKDLTQAYGFAIYHNSAARLERVGVENFGPIIETSFDQSMVFLKAAKLKLDEDAQRRGV